MSNCKRQMRGFFAVAALMLATVSWGANRMDMWATDIGDPNDPFDDFSKLVHPFVSSRLQPWQESLYVDRNFNAIDPAVNANAVPTNLVLHGISKACQAWSDISISSFKFQSTVTPVDQTFPKFPGQQLIQGATGLDGYNLVTFQDPNISLGAGVVGMSMTWKVWRDFDLSSFINLPPNVIMPDPPGGYPPTAGQPVFVRVDFDGDGYADIILEARKYLAGETIEGDTWLNQVEAWHQWPDDPKDLPTTSGGRITRPDTLGSLDVEAAVTHEFGHLLGIAHTNIERATMYYLVKGSYAQGFRYPTDVWDMRSLDLDDEIGAALIYPAYDSKRGTISGRVLDGRNFDGVPDRTSGVIDAVLYGTVFVARRMTSGTIPAYVPDKLLITTGPVSQHDLDTSAALYMELLTQIQSGDDIRVYQFPHLRSLQPNGRIVGATTATLTAVPLNAGGGIPVGIDASPNFHIPGLPPFNQYVLWMDAFNVYYNDSGGTPTSNISDGFNIWFGTPAYQTIPQEFYGGLGDPIQRRLIGPDGPIPGRRTTPGQLTWVGDDFTSYVFVSVRAGEVTAGIDIYTNTGGLPPGVTPTPLPGVTPTPTAIGQPRFTPDAANDHLLPIGSEWAAAAAAGDVDNDGDIDLYICNAVSGGGNPNPISIINRLYINTLWEPGPNPPGTRYGGRRSVDGKPVYEDRTFGADGIAGTPDDRLPLNMDSSFYAKMGDFNLDGYQDIFVCNSNSVNSPDYWQNRLLINRGGQDPSQAGFFDDWTSRTRTDAAIGIPISFTATFFPGRFNVPPFNPSGLQKSTKCDVGDIDCDGDLDIVVCTAGLFWTGGGASSGVNICAAPTNVSEYPIICAVSEQILINHANDFDPRTRGFYFTDETLGLDDQFGEFPGGPTIVYPNCARTNREAADRLPPLPPVPNNITRGNGWQPILAPILSNGALDLFVVRDATGGAHDLIYENSDVDGDGVPDGYFRMINYGTWEYGSLKLPSALAPIPTPFAQATWTGLWGVGIEESRDHSGCPYPPGWPSEPDVIPRQTERGSGGVVADFDYHGYLQCLSLNFNTVPTLYDPEATVNPTNTRWAMGWGTKCAFRGQLASFGGYGNAYGVEMEWATPVTLFRPVFQPSAITRPLAGTGVGTWLARDVVAADFDMDGFIEAYVGYDKDSPENVVPHRTVPNRFFKNINGFGTFLDQTNVATSGTARSTYGVTAFDFDMDGDLDIFCANMHSQNALLLNQVYTADDYSPARRGLMFQDISVNPAFYDATPKFLPPYFMGIAMPPWVTDHAKVGVTAAVGDLNGDGLPDIVNANGAVATISGDACDVLLNHGEPANQGGRVFSPVSGNWPPPVIRSTTRATSTALLFSTAASYFGGTYFSPIQDYWLNHYVPAYHALMADFDLDGDYDVLLTTLGNGPLIYSNEDSADMVALNQPWAPTERAWNSVPDQDFLGDGILLPGGFRAGSGGSSLARLPKLVDPGPRYPISTKQQNRRACVGDFDHNGTIDILIGNGLPALQTTGSQVLTGGAPNVLLLNGIRGNPVGTFTDVTESNLPTRTARYTSGTQTITYRVGIPDDTIDVATADFDNDGFLEIILLNISNDASSSTRFLDNDGTGHFFDTRAPGSPDSTWVLPSFRGRVPSRILVADFDRRGDPTEDINGNGALDPGEDTNHNGVLDWWSTTQPPVFHGSWDVMVTFRDGGPPVLLLNKLPGPPGTQFGFVDNSANVKMHTYASVYGADIGDIDLDGSIDVALAIGTQAQLPHVLLLMNDGKGNFEEPTNGVPVNWSILADPALFYDDFHEIARDVKLFDVDGDGDLDMLVTYSGVESIPMTVGALNALYVNRLVPDGFNTINRFRTYRSPYVIRLTPGVGYQGMAMTVNLVGMNIDQGLRNVDFGPGISVVSLTRIGPNSFSAQLKISSTAPGGAHDVIATTTDGKRTELHGAFTVLSRTSASRAAWKLYR